MFDGPAVRIVDAHELRGRHREDNGVDLAGLEAGVVEREFGRVLRELHIRFVGVVKFE
jgi:hypothetical protein